jgi:hypothetical protein
MLSATLDSSVIAAVRFDEASNVLEVEFRSGRVYRYFMVRKDVYTALVAAESPGTYFNTVIKDRYMSLRSEP